MLQVSKAGTGRAEACRAAVGTLAAEAADWLQQVNLQVQLGWLLLLLLAELLRLQQLMAALQLLLAGLLLRTDG